MIRPMMMTANLLLATTAAADSVQMSGTATGTSQSTALPVADGHAVIRIESTYDGFSAGGPMATSNGTCTGSVELMMGQVASGGGHCVYTDADGDNWVVHWVPDGISPEGAMEGDWTITGGSGKYMGATGGGRFSSLTNPDDQSFVNTTTGSVTLK